MQTEITQAFEGLIAEAEADFAAKLQEPGLSPLNRRMISLNIALMAAAMRWYAGLLEERVPDDDIHDAFCCALASLIGDMSRNITQQDGAEAIAITLPELCRRLSQKLSGEAACFASHQVSVRSVPHA